MGDARRPAQGTLTPTSSEIRLSSSEHEGYKGQNGRAEAGPYVQAIHRCTAHACWEGVSGQATTIVKRKHRFDLVGVSGTQGAVATNLARAILDQRTFFGKASAKLVLNIRKKHKSCVVTWR